MKEEEMNDEQWAKYIAEKQKLEGETIFQNNKNKSLQAGKELFDAEKMDDLWVSRFRCSMNEDETLKDQQKLEREYYRKTDVMTIEEFAAFKKMLDDYD